MTMTLWNNAFNHYNSQSFLAPNIISPRKFIKFEDQLLGWTRNWWQRWFGCGCSFTTSKDTFNLLDTLLNTWLGKILALREAQRLACALWHYGLHLNGREEKGWWSLTSTRHTLGNNMFVHGQKSEIMDEKQIGVVGSSNLNLEEQPIMEDHWILIQFGILSQLLGMRQHYGELWCYWSYWTFSTWKLMESSLQHASCKMHQGIHAIACISWVSCLITSKYMTIDDCEAQFGRFTKDSNLSRWHYALVFLSLAITTNIRVLLNHHVSVREIRNPTIVVDLQIIKWCRSIAQDLCVCSDLDISIFSKHKYREFQSVKDGITYNRYFFINKNFNIQLKIEGQ